MNDKMFSFRKDTTRAESRKLVSEHNQNAENDRAIISH